MRLIDPIYFRMVFSGIKTQSIDISNKGSIPSGVTNFFEEICQHDSDIIYKTSVIKKFIFLALLPGGLDLDAISILSSIDKAEWKNFVSKYSKYLNINTQGQLTLFHQRFSVFLLLRSNQILITKCVKIILSNIQTLTDEEWVRQNLGYYYFLNEDFKLLFEHLVENESFQNYNWWSKDLSRLLDGIYLNNEIQEIDFTKLCELLRLSFDFSVQRKGVRIIVMNASKINWDDLNSFFYNTRFQYELAFEFSKHHEKLPNNWIDILMNEDHPVSYTFSYVWKYSQFNSDKEPNQQMIMKLWAEGSPYQRILIVMIWGFHGLKGQSFQWLDSLLELRMDWPYLIEEKTLWQSIILAKTKGDYDEEFNNMKFKLGINYQYIFENYWNLFEYNDRLNADVKVLWTVDCALELAYWINQHPVWEIGKIANEILINRLRVKEFRITTLEWLIKNWEIEEFYVLGEVMFELIKIKEEETFWQFAEKVINAKNCQLRALFISDLVTFMEYHKDKEFEKLVVSRLIPGMVNKATDIWEIQELLRLFKYLLDNEVIRSEIVNNYFNKIELLTHFDKPLEEDYNKFWQRAEKIKGFLR
jgi:hypothetical protein